jgi:hypothetical protein
MTFQLAVQAPKVRPSWVHRPVDALPEPTVDNPLRGERIA